MFKRMTGVGKHSPTVNALSKEKESSGLKQEPEAVNVGSTEIMTGGERFQMPLTEEETLDIPAFLRRQAN